MKFEIQITLEVDGDPNDALLESTAYAAADTVSQWDRDWANLRMLWRPVGEREGVER